LSLSTLDPRLIDVLLFDVTFLDAAWANHYRNFKSAQ